MDSLLGEYASDDSGDERTAQSSQPQQQNQSALGKQVREPPSSSQPQKRRKLLDLSIFPEHIQRALTSGVTENDSDSEEEGGQQVRQLPTKKGPSQPKANASGDPLLAVLPPPMKDEAVPLSNSVNLSVPTLGRQFTSEYDSRSNTVSDEERMKHEGILGPSFPDDEEEEAVAPVTAADHKRKQREIELMLLSGNVAALEDVGARVHDIEAPSNWDASHYKEQKQKEAAIIKQYTADGALKSVVQPTKLQNRRHQITSLAMKAAETEIALLEARNNRVKTKSQTQSRYGW